jgi:hypothetical protein
MPIATHQINRPLALLASPVSLVDAVGVTLIELFDPICRSAASCFDCGKILVSEARGLGGSANNPLTLPCTVGWLAEASNVPQHAGASCFCGDQLTSLRDGDPQGHPFKWLDREASVTRWPGLFSKRGPLRLCDTLKPQPRISAISAVSKVGSFARFKLSTI